MKKLITILLLFTCGTTFGQSWLQTGNTLQRQAGTTYINYRFSLGSPGFMYLYTKPQIDSIISLLPAPGTALLKANNLSDVANAATSLNNINGLNRSGSNANQNLDILGYNLNSTALSGDYGAFGANNFELFSGGLNNDLTIDADNGIQLATPSSLLVAKIGINAGAYGQFTDNTANKSLFIHPDHFEIDQTGGQLNLLFDPISGGTKNVTLRNLSGDVALTSDLSSYVPTSRTITINGTTQDLSANRTYTVTATASHALTFGNGLLGGSYDGSTAITTSLDTSIAVTKTFALRYPLQSTTIAGFSLRSNITLASLTPNYGLIGSAYNASTAQGIRVDTSAIQTVANFFPKGDTRWAKAISGTGYSKYSGTSVSFVSAIPNGDLANSSITINGTPISLGGSVTTTGGTVTNVSSSTTDINVSNGSTIPVLTLNNVNGITKSYYDPTSSIQTQLNARELLSNKTATASSSTNTYPNWLGVENYFNTGISGTINQFSYFNGTNSLTSTSHLIFAFNSPYTTIGVGVGTPGINDPIGDVPHLFEINNDNNSQQVFKITSAGTSLLGGQNNMHWDRFGGTFASPTQTLNDMLFMSMGFRGADNTNAITTSILAFQAQAVGDLTTTQQNAKFIFQTTPTGSVPNIARRTTLEIGPDYITPFVPIVSRVTSDAVLKNDSAYTNRLYLSLKGTNAYGLWGIEGSSPTLFSGSSAYATVIGSHSNTPFQLGANAVVYETILPSGFVGLGYASDPTSGNILGVNGNSYFGGTGFFTSNLMTSGDFTVYRSGTPTVGVLFMNQAQTAYLENNSSGFSFNGGPLVVNGNLSATLPAYSSGTNLWTVYNSTNNRFETTTVTPLTNPMTFAGDIIVGGTSGTATRLAPGSPNAILGITNAGSAEEWKIVSGGTGISITNGSGSLQINNIGGSLIKYQHQIFTPTTGGTVNLTNGFYNIINPTGALLALTVNLPSSPANNDVVYIKFTQNVTTVTYGNGTVVDGITAPTAGGLTVLTYDQTNNSWY